jgi:hypothetical protein
MRAHFGHRGKINVQVPMNQRQIWWAVRDSNFLPSSLFSKLLNLLATQSTEITKITTHGHELGTALYPKCPLRRHPLPPSKFSTSPCAYLNPDHRLPNRRPVNIGLSHVQRFFLSFPVTLVTVLVRSKVTFHVFLSQHLSLHRLCVAPCAQGALKNENSSGFVHRLSSCSSPVCVYACCHAQRCVRSRTRPGWRSISVSPALWCPQGTGTVAGQASQEEVAPSQGASVRGRLAH